MKNRKLDPGMSDTKLKSVPCVEDRKIKTVSNVFISSRFIDCANQEDRILDFTDRETLLSRIDNTLHSSLVRHHLQCVVDFK